MDTNALIEDLRTTLLWENVCGYIESREEAGVLLQRAGVNDNITADSTFIQDSGAFDITDVSENSGSPNGKYDMCFSLYEACDGWEKQYIAVWEPLICVLEDIAVEKIGDDAIDEIFAVVSAAIRDTCWEKFVAFIERQHSDEGFAVSFDLFDMIKRDMAWAAVEKVLDISGFFTMLVEIYKEGYFPCSWNGEYPSGRAVVL